MRRALLVIVSLSVACGGSATPPSHPVANEAVVSTGSSSTTTPPTEPPKPEPKPETVASADPCEGGQVQDTGGDKGIGIGSIGGGGHGGGIGGNGYGAGAGGKPSPNAPVVHDSPATVAGSLDSELIRRIVRRHMNEIRYCYEKALQKNPKLEGRVVAKFTIDKDGKVTGATADGVDPEVSGCIAERIKRWEFPKPEGGGVVTVSYPFVFTSGGN